LAAISGGRLWHVAAYERPAPRRARRNVPRDIKAPVADALEVELDRLFRLPLAELVEARDALADRLRKAGEKALATRVKGVRRATPAAWALNQLHFEQPEVLDRAREASDEVRALHAQDGVDPRALSAALISQRAVLHDAVEAALERCEAAGLAVGPVLQRKLLATLQAVLAGKGDEGFGRLTRDLEASGFDAIASVGSAAPLAEKPRPPVTRQKLIKASPVGEEVRQRLAGALRERELSAHDAHKRVQQCRAELAGAQKEQAIAEARAREAEAALAALRDRLAVRTAESARLQAIVEQAIAQEAEARAALDQAQRELAALDHEPT
jgi:hypothetical protein